MQLLYKHKVTVDQLKDMLESDTPSSHTEQNLSGVQTKSNRKSPKAHNGLQRVLFNCPQGIH
jgi:hypothetical protein